MKDIIVIVGPTGVGKTKCSVELAKELDAEIINGDSVAIYKKLDIGSAKPTKEEQDGVVHHLLDIRNVDEDYTVYHYQKDVRRLIEDITSRGKRIIIVGGTGLYIKAALYDYRFTTGTVNNNYDNLDNKEIRDRLIEAGIKDIPEVENRKRLVRLLNKVENREEITYDKDKLLYPIKVIGLTMDRDNLYNRINSRVDKMFKDGLVEEVESLKEYYPNSRILNSGIGYKEFYDYLFNNKSLEEVKEEIKLHSRRYAKRQFTFFRHQFPTNWVEVDTNNFNNTINEVLDIIKKE